MLKQTLDLAFSPCLNFSKSFITSTLRLYISFISDTCRKGGELESTKTKTLKESRLIMSYVMFGLRYPLKNIWTLILLRCVDWCKFQPGLELISQSDHLCQNQPSQLSWIVVVLNHHKNIRLYH